MNTATGGCHCGNIRVELGLSRSLNTYNPRACDCDFCVKHNSAYLSDPQGSATMHIEDDTLLGKYQQGSGNADFLFCKKCGVLAGVSYQNAKQRFVAINSLTMDAGQNFGERTVVSPKKLSENDKIKRWKEFWFSEVYFTVGKS